MNVSELAIFKFRNLEGVLESWYHYETTSSVYKKGLEKIVVSFNLKEETATIVDSKNPFSEKTFLFLN